MALTAGSRFGPYEVIAPLGAGGMGEVYRATDTNLKRQVALKVLPVAFVGDAERLARFQREAELLAALNHPHIAQIYGLEKAGGVSALAMELVEGEDLAQRITRGPVPLDEAVAIARQVTEALEAAHEQGIVHRDLKPANIKVRPDGTVKVLDFGLAKALDPATSSGDDPMHSPTITSPALTAQGVLLGTAAYMAPEQARGRPVDRRADLWAFGAVLYEMLTGQCVFKGEDTTDTIVAVVSKEPDWSALPAGTPPSIRRLLRRCLEKDRKRRLDSAAAARLEIEDSGAPVADTPARSSGPPARVRLPWAIAAISLGGLIAAILAWVPWRPAPVPTETRLEVNAPATADPTAFSISPDGRQIVFVGPSDDGSQLWLRSLASTTAQPLSGTQGVGVSTRPFWSPDSRSIGFTTATALKRPDLGGGVPQTLTAVVGGGRGATWNADGVIVFAPNALSALMRVSINGGEASAVTTLGPQQGSHRWPEFLPDGRRYLFYAQGSADTAGIYLGGLDGSVPTRLTPSESAGVYLPSGLLAWSRGGSLVAQRLDLATAQLTGETATLADDVATYDRNMSAVSVAATGVVAYRTVLSGRRQLTWFDRSGIVRGTFNEPDVADLRTPRVAPDGRRVVVSRTIQGNTDLWLLDGQRSSRLTFDAAADETPLWSRDGTRIVFRSTRSGRADLYQKLASGAGAEEPLVKSSNPMDPLAWSANGRYLLYLHYDPQTSSDILLWPVAGDGRPRRFLRTPSFERAAALSPDDRWVAYQSNESGRYEIYLRPFRASDSDGAAGDGQWQVSTAGGIVPTWRPDGKELYYLNLSGAMMAVTIGTPGATPELGAPVVLFQTRIVGGGTPAGHNREYDVSPDGRFLINTELDDTTAPITVLMNWNPYVKR